MQYSQKMFQVKYMDGGIDMENLILSEVFNFQIYDMDGDLLFNTYTVKANTIEHRDRSNRLIIEDVLVNTKMFHDVMYGEYREKAVRVTAQTIVRSLDGEKAKLEVEIGVAVIIGYSIEGFIGDTYGSKMVIAFGDKDRTGSSNFNMNLQEIESYRKESDNGGYTFFE